MNYLVWQLIDSGFPSGGFAHSAGLEACVQHGHVAAGDQLVGFARQSLWQAGRSMLPLLTAAWRQPERLAELDRRCDVFLSNAVANRASRTQGRALLTGVSRSLAAATLTTIEQTARDERLGHYAPLFGAVTRALRMDLLESQRAFLFIGLRSVSSAAVRLGTAGAYEAQQLLAFVSPEIEAVIDRCGALDVSEMAQTAPLLDLFQSTHDRLYSRLFQS